MNDLLKVIFDQWQEERLNGSAENSAYSCLCHAEELSTEKQWENEDYLYNALKEVAERSFLVGFQTALGLKDLLDGKNITFFSGK